MLIDGTIIPRDFEKAYKLLKKFDKGKNGTVFLLEGKIKKKQDNYTKAMKYFEKASKHGNAEGMYEYGKMFLKGLGCEKNIKTANYYFEMSKNNGFKKSVKYLDYKQYMKEIADNGDIEEKYNYAIMLYNGDHGIMKDEREAFEYFKKNADKKHIESIIQNCC